LSRSEPGKKFRFKNRLLSIDSTTVELCANMFDWAKWRRAKGALKLHLVLDHDGYLPCFGLVTEGAVADVRVAQNLRFPKGSIVVMDRGYTDYELFSRWDAEEVSFVTRQKANADCLVIESRPVPSGSSVLRDETIHLKPFMAGRPAYPNLRRVVVWLEDKQEELEVMLIVSTVIKTAMSLAVEMIRRGRCLILSP
jgi:hypothetical protein